jgi:ribosomal protein S18 acetylase RimI-like enzyme
LWKEALTITPEFISTNEVYVATAEDKIVGFYGLILNGEVAQLEHLWISPDFIGGGIGKALFSNALQRAGLLEATLLEIESDPNAEGFYQKQGAVKISERQSVIEGKTRILPIMRIKL